MWRSLKLNFQVDLQSVVCVFFQNYYVENHERLKTYEKNKYHLKYDAIPKRKRGGVRKVLAVPVPVVPVPERL